MEFLWGPIRIYRGGTSLLACRGLVALRVTYRGVPFCASGGSVKTRNSWGTVKLNIFGGDLTIQRGTLGPSHESELLEVEGMRDGPACGAVSSGSVYDTVAPG